MNYMPREMKTQGELIRTRTRLDESGLLFVTVAEPRALLTFKSDSENLQEDVTDGIKGLFRACDNTEVEVRLLDYVDGELIWAVSSQPGTEPAFERILQVA